ncbi:MAG: alpha/beta fold hydrolase [Longimicrobiales bacterium]
MPPKGRSRSGPLPLHTEAFGAKGPPLLLLHGFATNGYTWSRWVPALSRTHRVFVVDMKGFGTAPKPRDGRYSPLDQADLLNRWIAQQDLQDLTLVGHSLGGGVALLTALGLRGGNRGRIRRLVLIAGIAYPQPLSRYLRLLANPVFGPLLLRVLPLHQVFRIALRRAYHPSRPLSEPHVAAYVQPLRTSAGRYALSRAAAQLATPESVSLAAQYPEVALPTLLLWGREDPVVPLWVAERLLAELPNARLEILDRCGHMPQEEAAEESLRILQEFLAESA